MQTRGEGVKKYEILQMSYVHGPLPYVAAEIEIETTPVRCAKGSKYHAAMAEIISREGWVLMGQWVQRSSKVYSKVEVA